MLQEKINASPSFLMLLLPSLPSSAMEIPKLSLVFCLLLYYSYSYSLLCHDFQNSSFKKRSRLHVVQLLDETAGAILWKKERVACGKTTLSGALTTADLNPNLVPSARATLGWVCCCLSFQEPSGLSSLLTQPQGSIQAGKPTTS